MSVSQIFKSERTQTSARFLLLKYRLTVLYRFIIALLGGYVLATVSALYVLELCQPVLASTVLAATMLAFVVHVITFMVVFISRSSSYAALLVVVPSAVFYACLLIIQG
ncbi:hypothetical protein [Acinetobacter rudis]|uniref:Iron transporter n=1 Tax=Acinetobacter rudis TaxID=632955 RepID=A0AAW8J5Y0_9GAMM|nr:hypothetical protein [Acinetobacter rudis]MDQ8934533.1 hypothetical protein [Acinetobacter rudis]MDQ8951705.1 hypothetical protein [Acinetobacter rudis]MDQ9016897.1 hypothetical protein [Acinetobacter rudis]